MLSPRDLEQLVAEFERLGVPSHEGGRLWTFDSAGISGREMLRRLRRLPDGAGHAAAMAALKDDLAASQ
jgi:hypothetical protein